MTGSGHDRKIKLGHDPDCGHDPNKKLGHDLDPVVIPNTSQKGKSEISDFFKKSENQKKKSQKVRNK